MDLLRFDRIFYLHMDLLCFGCFCSLHEFQLLIEWFVAEQRVTVLELLDCVASKGMETETIINLAASIHEWQRILFRSRDPDGQVCMGCMGNDDLSRVGSLEMTALLMSVVQRCILEGGRSARKVASGRSQAEKLSRGRWWTWAIRSWQESRQKLRRKF